jgi:hypothetical protein
MTGLSAADLNTMAVSAIIADAVIASRGVADRWPIYEQAKDDIDLLNLDAEQYPKVIRLLTDALGI